MTALQSKTALYCVNYGSCVPTLDKHDKQRPLDGSTCGTVGGGEPETGGELSGRKPELPFATSTTRINFRRFCRTQSAPSTQKPIDSLRAWRPSRSLVRARLLGERSDLRLRLGVGQRTEFGGDAARDR